MVDPAGGLTDFLYQRDREIIAFARPDLAVSGTGSVLILFLFFQPFEISACLIKLRSFATDSNVYYLFFCIIIFIIIIFRQVVHVSPTDNACHGRFCHWTLRQKSLENGLHVIPSLGTFERSNIHW